MPNNPRQTAQQAQQLIAQAGQTDMNWFFNRLTGAKDNQLRSTMLASDIGIGFLAPQTGAEANTAIEMLQAAQRGAYSPLARSIFRQPSAAELYGDYALMPRAEIEEGVPRQDQPRPPNFLQFAAQKYGLTPSILGGSGYGN